MAQSFLQKVKQFVLEPNTETQSLDVHPLTLSFPGDLEDKFQEDYYKSSIRLLRLSFLLGIIYYTSFAALDFLVLPEVTKELAIIRFGIVCPIVLAIFFLSFSPGFYKWWQLGAVFASIVAGVGIVLMTIITPELGRHEYYPGIMLVLFYCYMLIKLRFIWASFAGWTIFLSYAASLIIYPDVPKPIIFTNLFFIASANVLGMFGGYFLEYYTRRDFYYRHLLRQETKKVEIANASLEQRVLEKTKELQEDIQKREKLEETLREREKTYRQLVETLNEGIWQIDSNGKTTFVNTQMMELLGYNLEYMEGSPLLSFIAAEQTSKAESLLTQLKNGKSLQYELRFENASGKSVYTLLNATPMYDEQGQYAGALMSIADITERKQAEMEQQELQQQLVNTQKITALGDVAGGIAHDFNNVLASLSGVVQMIELKDPDSVEISKYLNMAKSSLKQAQSITDRLLTFTRSSSPKAQVIDLKDVLTETVEILEHTLKKDIQIRFQSSSESHFVIVDPEQLQQVLTNMSINAGHAMPGGGALTFGVRPPTEDEVSAHKPKSDSDGMWCVTISDTGTGMSQDTMERIFDPYFTTKGEAEGSGLGLAVSHKIITNHNGWIDVASVVGEGTTFTIGLPQSAILPEKEDTSEVEPEINGTGTHILVVEDEPTFRNLLTEVLVDKGFTVTAVEDGGQAVNKYTNSPEEFDIVITDMGLPVMKGEEVLEHLFSIDSELKVIVITGYLHTDRQKWIDNQKVIGCLKKPFSHQKLLHLLEKVLSGDNNAS